MVEVHLRSQLQDGFIIFEAAQAQCHFSCIVFMGLASFFLVVFSPPPPFLQKQWVCASMQGHHNLACHAVV